MRRRALLAVLAAALGGCSGEADRATESTATLTPVPLPTETPSSTLAPGLDETGVVDPVALAHAHSDALQPVAHAVDRTLLVKTADASITIGDGDEATSGVLRRQHNRLSVLPHARRYLLVEEIEDAEAFPREAEYDRYEFWYDGTVGLARIDGPDEPRFQQSGRLDVAAHTGTDRDRLAALLGAFDPIAVDIDTSDRYRLAGNTVVRPETVSPPRLRPLRVRAGALTATVTEAGRVTHYSLRLTAAIETVPIVIDRQVSYDLGVEVAPPAWVDEARRAT